MKIESRLQEAVVKAIFSLYGQTVDLNQISLQKTKKEFEGQLT